MKEYKYKINGNQYKVAVGDIDDNIVQVEVNGTPFKVEIDKPAKEAVTVSKPTARPAARTAAKPAAKPAAAAATGGRKSGVKSPLPGVVLDIKAAVGDVVKRGQTVLILEAMKMENNINADKDGTITAINVNKGDSVMEGTDLLIIE